MGSNFAFYYTKHGSTMDMSALSTLNGATNQDEECDKSSTAKEPESVTKSIHHTDPMFYMYTSGTSGMPKAVVITHIRLIYYHYPCVRHRLPIHLYDNFSGNFSRS